MDILNSLHFSNINKKLITGVAYEKNGLFVQQTLFSMIFSIILIYKRSLTIFFPTLVIHHHLMVIFSYFIIKEGIL